MDIMSRIEKLKAEKLNEIAKSAKAGDTTVIVSSAGFFQKLERCQQQVEDILRTLNKLEQQETSPPTVPVIPSQPSYLNKKEKGEIRRKAFVDRLQAQGIHIQKSRGVRYHIPHDRTVGIAFASEASPDKWWLGLPPEEYYAIVLICENEFGATTNFIFPRAFYEQHLTSFSKSKNGQLQFNIRLRGDLYTMNLPGHADIYLTEYIDRIDCLQ